MEYELNALQTRDENRTRCKTKGISVIGGFPNIGRQHVSHVRYSTNASCSKEGESNLL